ncbi:conserved protein of unknown function [Rhodovastum atsumiense]|uniref:Lipoprotein n=1 Tax=Rhodovastum atsumiense TaxID=504468 RepID=A0A5M6IPH7_9PROT|nr:hypothetical protein [Rhodovastum atsumiense]KAA5609799.1 hypothetical protein F1189_22670 [Rhodovastum atsumiense]CAH2599416.1 conserved protein of unknown function [Rhodovastum atsumiense]
MATRESRSGPGWGRWFPAIGLVVALAGCTNWVKPGATEAMRDRQMAACQAGAFQHAPAVPVVVMTDPGGYRPPQRYCWKDKDERVCRTSPGYYQEPRYGTQDANSGARDAFFEDCMFRAGWTKE